jgi:hypothetical protein
MENEKNLLLDRIKELEKEDLILRKQQIEINSVHVMISTKYWILVRHFILQYHQNK